MAAFDIERLHKNTAELFYGDKYSIKDYTGLTTTYLYAMLGEAWFADMNHDQIYLYLTISKGHAKHVLGRFAKMLLIENIPFTHHDDSIFITSSNQQFIFSATNTAEHSNRFRGCRISRVYIDDRSPNTKARIEHALASYDMDFI